MLMRESSLLSAGIRPVLLFALFHRTSIYIRACLERPLFFGFRGSCVGRRSLWASLRPEAPKNSGVQLLVVVGLGVPRRFDCRHKPIGISCALRSSPPVIPAYVPPLLPRDEAAARLERG